MSRKLSLVIVVCLVFSALVAPSSALAVDPLVANRLRLTAISWGDSMHGWAVGENGAMLMTADGGANWHVQWAPTSADLTDVDFVSAMKGWVTTSSGGVLRTTDGGITWTTKQVTNKRLNGVDFYDSTHGWVVGEDMTAFRTTDGISWTRLTLAPGSSTGTDIRGVSFANTTTGWVCGGTGVGDGFSDLYIAKTTNGGASWTRQSNGPDMGGGSDDTWSYDDIDFSDATHGWVTGFLAGMHATTNGGSTWLEQPAGGNAVAAYNNTRVGSATFGGHPDDSIRISVTTNGGDSWTHRLQPIDFPEGFYGFPDVAWQDSDNLWVVGPGFMVHHNVAENTWVSSVAYDRAVNFVGGHDRYATSVELSKRSFSTASTVVLATGLAFPDGLSASALCGAYEGPLLLTGSTLPATVKAEIARLGATKVIIVGGPAAVSSSVAAEVDAMPGVSIERLWGADRYETSRQVAAHVHSVSGDRPRAFVVRGDVFADALAAGPAAYAHVYPILLVEPNDVPSATGMAIEAGGYGAFTVVGGTSAVSDDVASTIGSVTGKTVNRVFGEDRYATASSFAQYSVTTFGMTSSHVGLATGLNFPDALSAGPALGAWESVLLLTDPKTLSAKAAEWTEANDPSTAWIVGDRQGAVSDKAANAFSRLIQ